MKNLTVHRTVCRPLSLSTILENAKDQKILCALNPNNDDLYILIERSLYKIASENETSVSSMTIAEDVDDEFCALEYSVITQELYLGSITGRIFRIDVNLVVEEVTQLQNGLHCMTLSPDHEIFTIVTHTTVVTMVSTFDIISEIDLYSCEFGQEQFVTVGWGSKETQFHGSQGKSAASAKEPTISILNDTGVPKITWREDGSMFAVSFLNNDNSGRRFKVFNREGVLQYTSELIAGLGECLAWRPSGGLIAADQILPNRRVIALFEKNGLKHREFMLPVNDKEIQIKNLSWSLDSELLAIHMYKSTNSTSTLQLWTERNYHWYLKYTFIFSKEDPLLYVAWSAIFDKKLILLSTHQARASSFDWCIDRSRGIDSEDKCIIGVIDSSKILLTSFRKGGVPPPMAHITIDVGEEINSIVFGPDIKKNDSWVNGNTFFCVSSSSTLTFYTQSINSDCLDYFKVGSYNVEWQEVDKFRCSVHHFLWVEENIIMCSMLVDNRAFVCVLKLEGITPRSEGHVIVRDIYSTDAPIEHIFSSPSLGIAYIATSSAIFKYTGKLESIEVQLKESCCKIQVVRIGTRDILVSLSKRNNFFIDGELTASNITSFCIHSEFLLLTTLQHTLICVDLSEKGIKQLMVQDLTVKPWENGVKESSFLDLNVRRVERGSYLIASIFGDSRTILQMPRGNLECIQPRALSLNIIGQHLDNCDYLKAFDMMRKQRINLNLIHDHDPPRFKTNADKFLDDISNPNWLSLFLSDLQDEDVTSTLYKSFYNKKRSDSCQAINTEEKIDKMETVCDLLYSLMEKRNDDDRLIQPMLMSLVKNRKKQGLEAALRKIERCKSQSQVITEEALQHLLYLVDINLLYDTALGMYDFDLTIFIASKSQKDPKEYMPFLNHLKSLSDNRMKYSIDLHLKRYESALTHLAQEPGSLKECIDLIKNQNLYNQGLRLFHQSSNDYTEIARAYSEFLEGKKKYREAGIMFSKAGDLQKALEMYKKAGNWQDVIIISSKMDKSPLKQHTLYKELVQQLRSERKYYDAAQIQSRYLKDTEEAVACLCDGRYWKEAMRISCDAQRLDLIETHIKPNILECANHVSLEIQKNTHDFLLYKTRLSRVRNDLAKRGLEISKEAINQCESPKEEILDFLSDTTSITNSVCSQRSMASGRSYRSSKNRRKQERKLISLKEGSAFEDLGLIRALHHIISKTYKERDELSNLTEMLVQLDNENLAEDLQNNMDEFLRIIDKSKDEIWSKSTTSSFTMMQTTEMDQTKEFYMHQKLIEPHMLIPPQDTSPNWKLHIFKTDVTK